jgi:hypothetical protein
MQAKSCIPAAVVAIAVLAGSVELGNGWSIAGPAQAKDFYTRKRINGVWVRGHFPRREAAAGKAKPREAAIVPAVVKVPDRSAPPVAFAIGQNDYMQRLQRALEARAKNMTTDGAPVPVPKVKRVSYDFETMLKTTVYVDGSSLEKPFDAEATGQIATAP